MTADRTTTRTAEGVAPPRPPGRMRIVEVWRSGARGPVQLTLLLAIRAYQLTVSPMLGDVCRFYPSCSRYGFEAVHVHGAARGSWLTARRLVRCHPWNPGGVDLVPPRRSHAAGTDHVAPSPYHPVRPEPPRQGAPS